MNYNWDWAVFFRQTVLADGTYLDWLVRGTLWTIATSLSAWVIALAGGAVLGILLTVPNRPVRLLAQTYIELFRNVPLIVQMFLWYFVAPELLPSDAGRWVKREMPLPEFTTAVIALGLYTAARVAIQVAAGLNSLSRGQRNAALALGMTETQTYRYVPLPNAARIMVPTLTTEFMSIVKNSAVALTIGLFELTASSRSIAEYTFQGFEAFTAATIIYIVLALSANAMSGAIDRWTAIPRNDGAR